MQSSKLFVGNLDYSATNEQLQELFAEHGQVQDVNVIVGKGFGFVEMASSEEAKKAMTALDGTEFMGRPLKVDEARPPRPKQDRGNFRRF